MLNIIKPIGKFAAECRCSKCGSVYFMKNKYLKSPIKDLCSECKAIIQNISIPTQKNLTDNFNYDPNTGDLTFKHNSASGRQNAIATFSHTRGYLSVLIGSKQYLAHRIIYMMMTGNFPEEHIDHINHIKHDNRWCNLRAVKQATNNKNMPKQINTKTGVVGVSLHKPTGKYRAYITVKSKAKHLGLFESIEAASAARDLANIQYGYHQNHGR